MVLQTKFAQIRGNTLYIDDVIAAFKKEKVISSQLEDVLYYLYLAKSLPQAAQKLDKLIAMLNEHSLQQIDQGAFSRSGLTHDADGLSRLCFKADVL